LTGQCSCAASNAARAIEDALVKLEHELEAIEGEHRATLVAEIRRRLKKVARIELHQLSAVETGQVSCLLTLSLGPLCTRLYPSKQGGPSSCIRKGAATKVGREPCRSRYGS